LDLAVGDEWVKSKSLNAGNLVRELAKHIKGGGGGQAFYATAGGSDSAGMDAALSEGQKLVDSWA